MGTTFPKKDKNSIQFSAYVEKSKQNQTDNETERWEQLEQPYECCGFKYKKTIKRKVTWQSLFISNCQEIQNQFQWAKDMREMLVNCILTKEKYIREMSYIKSEAFTKVTTDQVLENEEQLQSFKRNLKKSVLISLNGSFINNKPNNKSDLSNQQKMISTISKTEKQSKIKFQFERYRVSGVSSFMQVVLRKSVASLMDDTITQIMGIQKQISKKNAKELEVFLKFTMMLQNHLNDVNCTLGRIQRLFILFIEKNYRHTQKVSKDIGHFVDNIKQYLLLIRESVVDFYGLHVFQEKNQNGNVFISNQQNVLSAVTAILFKDSGFYTVIFNYISTFNMERQSDFMQILNNLNDSPPQRFYIKQKFCLNLKTIHSYLNTINKDSDPDIPFDIQDVVIENNSTPYSQCINSLRELVKTKSPINKMKAIMACSQNISQQIQKFYYQHGLKRQNWILDADQVLSIFCYVIVNARVQNLYTHLFILQNFATSHQMISMTGYYLSVITCAVQQIKNDYGSDTRLSRPAV